MTITFLDLYNKVTGQAWSMFDGEIEDEEEFETTVTSSLQKALTALWCSYKFPFRYRKKSLVMSKGKTGGYDLPNGNIIRKVVSGKEVYGVKYDNERLPYAKDPESLDSDTTGEPEQFWVENDYLYFYPAPDDKYKITLEYLTVFTSCDENGNSKAVLENDSDYIDLPEKYENLFLCCLLPLSMMYLIADPSDENYPGYKAQYDDAYKNLIEFTRGIDFQKTIGWR